MAENKIAELLDFSKPHVGYEDEEHRDVCGCCGTYYVVSPGELADAKKRVSAMYEALKTANRLLTIASACGMRFGASDLDKIDKALNQAEGK